MTKKCIKDNVDKEIQEKIKRSLHVQFKWYVDWFLFSHTGHIWRGKEGTPWQDTLRGQNGHGAPSRGTAWLFLEGQWLSVFCALRRRMHLMLL